MKVGSCGVRSFGGSTTLSFSHLASLLANPHSGFSVFCDPQDSILAYDRRPNFINYAHSKNSLKSERSRPNLHGRVGRWTEIAVPSSPFWTVGVRFRLVSIHRHVLPKDRISRRRKSVPIDANGGECRTSTLVFFGFASCVASVLGYFCVFGAQFSFGSLVVV